MYANKGNSKHGERAPKRRKRPTADQMAMYIAESITAKKDAGVEWTWEQYGIADQPEKIKAVMAKL